MKQRAGKALRDRALIFSQAQPAGLCVTGASILCVVFLAPRLGTLNALLGVV